MRSEVHGDWKVIVVAGELDADTVPELADHLKDTVVGPADQVVVDLGEVPFMDTTGLALLLDCHRRLDAGGGRFRLAALRSSVRKLFRLTELIEIMSVHETVPDAMAAP